MVALWNRKPKPNPNPSPEPEKKKSPELMCKSKSSVATAAASSSSSMAAATTPRKQQRSPRTAATYQYSSSSAGAAASTTSGSSSLSTAASLQALRDSLPSLPLLLSFPELAAATSNFSSSHRLTQNSPNSTSFRCSLRGHPAAVFRRPLRRRDACHVSSRLAVLGHCHHAAIAHLLGAAASPDSGSVFLAYELLAGATPLSSLLRSTKNPAFTPLATWQARLKVAADVSDALHYVHLQANTIHNRLSSSTVLVSGDGDAAGDRLRAKIAHFGAADLAGELNDDGDRRHGRRIEGTRGYMAPELIAGGSPSRRSDVYALGVVLLELVSGDEPVRYEVNRATGEYERTSLIESAAAAAAGGEEAMRRWVDRRLKDSFPVEAAEAMTALALRCVAEDGGARPEMAWVAAKVSKLFLEAQDWADKFRLPTDISVSIAPR
uniref:Protein kinase domain-containing protein n=1 Tax=Leersia perrieri TaxID=77586 RepID=A0A0D9VMS3_9ORYZ